ncbi:hypothetical protein UCMB321_4274 [Pseudomonas batumici]|uniref:Uncharacterized protein n=1 Tax=Pseudomonas batumici TaxID=226910 RepID=A0A0C2E7U8_9PSED|nr:hypothetical protein UCMB321_4274 [Pseudomonas batumici]
MGYGHEGPQGSQEFSCHREASPLCLRSEGVQRSSLSSSRPKMKM